MVCGCKDASKPHVALAYVASAFVLKLVFGIDDLVWLAPFLAREGTTKGRAIVGAKYVLVNLVLCCIAVACAEIVHASLHSAAERQERIADKVIACIAGGLLLLYAAHLIRNEGWCASTDGISHRDRHPEEAKRVETTETSPLVPEASARADDEDSKADYEPEHDFIPFDKDDEEPLTCCEQAVVTCLSSSMEPADPGQDEARRRFIIVAALGNLDDFIVYFSIVVGTHFCWYEFIAGTTLGAILIATVLGTCLAYCDCLAECLKHVPLTLILVCMAIYIIVQAFVPAFGPSEPRGKCG